MRPSAGLDALVCGYASLVRARKVVVIVTPIDPSKYVAFADESGGDGDRRILLLSALIHRYPAWEKFCDDWVSVLDAPPKISGFHMREARRREKEFANWKAIDLDRKIVALTEVIVRHKPHVVSCWVSEDEYKEIVRGVAPYDLRHAYFTCFCSLVINVAEYQALRGITTPADYVFDDKGDTGNEALMWYAALKQSVPAGLRPYMGSTPVFRKDDDILPLQAADVVAWHKRRKKEIRGLDSEVAASMRIDELPGAEFHISREVLEDIAHKMSKVPHVKEFADGPSVYKRFKRAVRQGKKEF